MAVLTQILLAHLLGSAAFGLDSVGYASLRLRQILREIFGEGNTEGALPLLILATERLVNVGVRGAWACCCR